MRRLTGQVLLVATLAAPAAAQTYNWSGSILELDCRGVESASGTIAKERACMEIAANAALEEGRLVCTANQRVRGNCPANRTIDQYFPKVRLQDCTDRDIPGDRGRCRYGRGVDTFDNSSCTDKDQPIPECTGSGTGNAPERPTCNEAEWGHISRDLQTLADFWCNGSEPWVAVVNEEPEKWHPALFEGANRTTVSALPTCDATHESVAVIVTDGTNASDCSVGGGSNQHRCRCLSSSWTDEVKEYQIFPPSGTLPSSPSVPGLPPCTASTNNLRAWVGPFVNYPEAPWIEGTLYDCQHPTPGWVVNSGNYRIGEDEDGLGDVIRPWCRDLDLSDGENCWVTAPSDHPTAWIEDQGQDLVRRRLESASVNRREDGQRKIRDAVGVPVEEN